MITHEKQTRTPKHHEEVVPLQTIQRSFEQICAGEDPWLPLGNFMHQFFGYYKHRRIELVADPIKMPEQLNQMQRQWTAFCAASVEYLCKKYDIPCPQWVLHSQYTLETVMNKSLD